MQEIAKALGMDPRADMFVQLNSNYATRYDWLDFYKCIDHTDDVSAFEDYSKEDLMETCLMILEDEYRYKVMSQRGYMLMYGSDKNALLTMVRYYYHEYEKEWEEWADFYSNRLEIEFIRREDANTTEIKERVKDDIRNTYGATGDAANWNDIDSIKEWFEWYSDQHRLWKDFLENYLNTERIDDLKISMLQYRVKQILIGDYGANENSADWEDIASVVTWWNKHNDEEWKEWSSFYRQITPDEHITQKEYPINRIKQLMKMECIENYGANEQDVDWNNLDSIKEWWDININEWYKVKQLYDEAFKGTQQPTVLDSNPCSQYDRNINPTELNTQDLIDKIYEHLHKEINYEGGDTYKDLKKAIGKLRDYKERRDKSISGYEKWVERMNQDSGRVKDIMDRLNKNPTRWSIEFDELSNRDREILLPLLKGFFDDTIAKLPIDHYKLRYRVGKSWHNRLLIPEVWNDLMKNLTEDHFLFNIQDQPPDYFYEDGGGKLPEWSLFSAIEFLPIDHRSKVNNDNGRRKKVYADRGGSFFKYLLTDDVPSIVKEYLKRLQIFDTLLTKDGTRQRDELNDCCFVYALKQTGRFSDQVLDKIRLRVNSRYLSNGKVRIICEEFGINLRISYLYNTAHDKIIEFKQNDTDEPINVCFHEKHYFIEEKTPFSHHYITHMNTLDESYADREPKNQKYYRKTRSYISSSQLVRALFDGNYLRQICYGDVTLLKTVFHNSVDKDISGIDLEFNEKHCTRLIAPKKKLQVFAASSDNGRKRGDKKGYIYWYADFESDVSGAYHIPFMCVLQSADGSISKTFVLDDAVTGLLTFLPNDSVVYFHNLAYDVRMICTKADGLVIKKSVVKGGKVFSFQVVYKGKSICFKDTLPILSCKLSLLPKMFDLGIDVKKELFPYKYYTKERLMSNIGVIMDAGKEEDEPWTDKDYMIFNENIDRIGCRCEECVGCFDMMAYAEFYCKQDVNILRLGFNAFRDGFIKDFDLDPYDFLTISSLANEVFNKRVYYNNDLYQLGGNVRMFVSQAIRGGRCMTAYNKKWHIQEPLNDFDAVSLYPSAMARLYTVKGRPKVIPEWVINGSSYKGSVNKGSDNSYVYEWLKDKSAYVVEIRITAVRKHYPFPLLVTKVNGKNINDDNLSEPMNTVVDNITLEDLIEFQGIEFEVIRGYYWDGERDYTIQSVIKELFSMRAEYKRQKNPLEQLYKLIMNSCYGKTIQRPVNKKLVYKREGDELDRYWTKNYNKIIDDIQIDGSRIHVLEVNTQIDDHFNYTLLGIHVLAMSKRIMNEVMCLAHDIGCKIYYQDTDSMHIRCQDIDSLSKAFSEKYGRELIGKELGQFHNDFACINGHSDMPVSVESYFIGKKLYIDKLRDDSGDVDYHIRGKGLTQKSIEYKVKEEYDGDPMKLYKALYDGTAVVFDLTKGQPCFKMDKNMTVSTLKKFVRRICVQ